MLGDLFQSVLAFVRDHGAWAPLITFVLAFCESLAFLSLLVPASTILIGVGALIGVARLDFFSLWLSAAFGAFMGDWLSYWLGWRYRDRMLHVWPLSRHPKMVENGQLFFRRWGTWSVFLGRFLGPLRAVVPLLAGIMGLPQFLFQLANFVSAAIWAFVLLAPGAFAFPLDWRDWLDGNRRKKGPLRREAGQSS